MIILTDNQYFKIGLECLIKEKYKNDKERIMIFDTGEKIYLLKTNISQHFTPAFFDFLAKATSHNKKDINTEEKFISCLNSCKSCIGEGQENLLSGELSWPEEIVLSALYSGYSPIEITKLLNTSIKMISAHKNRALKKLRMRNIQILHRTIVRWDILAKGLCPQQPQNKYSQDYFNCITVDPSPKKKE